MTRFHVTEKLGTSPDQPYDVSSMLKVVNATAFEDVGTRIFA